MDKNQQNSKSSGFKRGAKAAFWGLVGTAVALAVSTPLARNAQRKAEQRLETILPASIRPHTVATISSKFPGQVAAVQVTPGATVKAGDVLLTLVNPDLEMEYAQAKLHLQNIQERLAHRTGTGSAVDQPAQAQRALEAAKERLANFSIEEVQSAYNRAAAKAKELQKLSREQLATEIEVEEARKVEQVELRNLRAEQEHLSRLKEEVEAAKARLQEARSLQAPSAAEVLNLKMELSEAAEALRIAGERRESQKITSTMSGTVLRAMVSLGDQIASGIPLVQIAQLDQLDFDVPVGAEIAQKVKVGQMVKLRVPTEPPTQISAPVSKVMLIPAQDQTAYTVRITTRNPSPSVVLVGLNAEAAFSHPEGAWRVFPF